MYDFGSLKYSGVAFYGTEHNGTVGIDWVKITSAHPSKSNCGDISRLWTMKIGGNESVKPTVPGYLLTYLKSLYFNCLSYDGAEE